MAAVSRLCFWLWTLVWIGLILISIAHECSLYDMFWVWVGYSYDGRVGKFNSRWHKVIINGSASFGRLQTMMSMSDHPWWHPLPDTHLQGVEIEDRNGFFIVWMCLSKWISWQLQSNQLQLLWYKSVLYMYVYWDIVPQHWCAVIKKWFPGAQQQGTS